ncbi:MAG: methionyl-tRNA formyltransferase [Turicibacter sp.]|nr:methionyl-tRNA formyltransferase [Turicibacter sp.]
MARIVFMGTPPFSVDVLNALVGADYEVVGVVTQPDRPVGRKWQLTPTPVKEAALKHEIPVFQPEKIKEDYEQVLAWQPDLIITAAFGQIIPKVLLDAPKLGCINVHASLLPKYRGGAPIHQAIMDGNSETGVTIMYMDVAMDTGDMIAKVSVPIEDEDHTGRLFEKLAHAGSKLLIETLPKLMAGEIQAEKQNADEATFAWNIKREQEVIDWNRPARAVYNQVRGLHPWPVAFTTLEDGTAVKIWWGKPVEFSGDNAKPGTVLETSKQGIIVACGENSAFAITDLQLAGKKRMEVSAVLNGTHPFGIGTRLG